MNPKAALKYDSGHDKLPWDLLPFCATEGALRVLLYGRRKYTFCGACNQKTYENPRLDGDPTTALCLKCGSDNLIDGAHNWRKGFDWTRLIAASFRHLTAFAKGHDIDDESGLPHVDHLLVCVMFLSEHMKLSYGYDNRYKETK
jgi:hypothetical protein